VLRKFCGVFISYHLACRRSAEEVDTIFFEISDFRQVVANFKIEIRRKGASLGITGRVKCSVTDDLRSRRRYLVCGDEDEVNRLKC
jgi:hypothetical protein